jgi:beta-glucosidase
MILPHVVAFAGLTLASSGVHGLAQGRSTDVTSTIELDTYFYGQSPPVYPAPVASGTGDWKVAYQKAKIFIAKLTTAEKVRG